MIQCTRKPPNDFTHLGKKGNKLNMKHKRRFGKRMQMNLKRDRRAKKKAVVFLGIIPIFL